MLLRHRVWRIRERVKLLLLPRALRFDRYDQEAMQAVFFARKWVSEMGGASMEPEHLLAGLVEAAPGLFDPYPMSTETLLTAIRDPLPDGDPTPVSGGVPMSEALYGACVRLRTRLAPTR